MLGNILDNVVAVLLLGSIFDIGEGASQLSDCFVVGVHICCQCCLCKGRAGVHLRQRLLTEAAAQLLLHSLGNGHLLDANKGQDGTFILATCCTSSSMYIGCDITWKIKVDHIVDTLEIDTTRCT